MVRKKELRGYKGLHYEEVVEFVRELLAMGHIRSYIVEPPYNNLEDIDMGLRSTFLGEKYNRDEMMKRLQMLKNNVLYYLRDSFFCEYICMKLPDGDGQRFLIIGPYTFVKIDQIRFMDYLGKAKFSPSMIEVMKKYYKEVQLIGEETKFKVAISAVANKIWGKENYQTSYYVNDAFWKGYDFQLKQEQTIEIVEEQVKEIEFRYNMENQIMNAVQNGNYKEIEELFRKYSTIERIKKSENVLRDYKNYLIILNTLLRKAAERGAVPSVYLHEVSTKIANAIEEQTTPDDLRFEKEMIRKYCVLVQNQSLRGYSPIIQGVVNQINMNLLGELSLKSLAEKFNISSGYLSTTFKKEVGVTLTEYVNNRRIDHSVFLLNTTMMQIQDIASCCGFVDANYYSRIFKKRKGITPSKYHELITKGV